MFNEYLRQKKNSLGKGVRQHKSTVAGATDKFLATEQYIAPTLGETNFAMTVSSIEGLPDNIHQPASQR